MNKTKERLLTVGTMTNPLVWIIGIPFYAGALLGSIAKHSIPYVVNVVEDANKVFK